METDLRATPRHTCRARFIGAATTHFQFRGSLVDLSTFGLCAETERPVKRGQVLHLEFELPTGIISAVGEVRWIHRRGATADVGIRFIRIPSPALAAIQQAVERESLPTGEAEQQYMLV